MIANQAHRLAQLFHSLYNDLTVIDKDNEALTKERLSLVKACAITLKTTLSLLGIEAKESMKNDQSLQRKRNRKNILFRKQI